MKTDNTNPSDYREYYETAIEEKIKELDILLKSGRQRIGIHTAAKLLSLPETEIKRILADNGRKTISPEFLMIIMRQGSSYLCTAFRNILVCGDPPSYSAEDLSFIYQIDILEVLAAFRRLGINEVEKERLLDALSLIPCKLA